MAEGEQPRLRIFISYSRKDQRLKDQLLEHLSSIGGVDAWTDDRILPGDESRSEMKRALDAADVVLLLVSPSFLASDFIADAEVARLFERRDEGRVRVIPVLLKTCLWGDHPLLAKLGVLPKGALPIAFLSGDRRNQAMSEVAGEIARLARSAGAKDAPRDVSPPRKLLTQYHLRPSELPSDKEAPRGAAASPPLGTSSTLELSNPTPPRVDGPTEGSIETPTLHPPAASPAGAPAPGPSVNPLQKARTLIYAPGTPASVPRSDSCVVVVWTSDDKQRGKRYVVRGAGISIGRDPENDISIDDPTISGRHCCIRGEGKEVVVQDLGSTNGTYVNDVNVRRQGLVGGEQLWLGATVLKYLTGTDITAHFHEIVSELATTDAATGVYNARHMRDEIARLVERAVQRSEPFTMVALAVDHARQIEASYGDTATDAVLVEIVRRIKAALPQVDTVGRDGSACFLLALPRTGLAEGKEMAELVRQAVEARDVFYKEYAIRTTVSIGVAELSAGVPGPDLVRLARERRYAAERAGGNQVVEAAVILHRLQDAEWMIRRMVAAESFGAVAAFEMEDETSLISQLGRRVRDEWFKELVDDVEFALHEADMIATWQERYVLAGLVNRRAGDAESFLARVRERWTTRPVPAKTQHVAVRALRLAALGPEELRTYREASLDEILVRLVHRNDFSAEGGDEERLPFPIAVIPAVVRTRPTALSRARALSRGIEVILRLAVALELSALLLLNDPAVRQKVASTLRPYVESRLSGRSWENLAYKLGILGKAAGLGERSVARLLIGTEAGTERRSDIGKAILEVILRADRHAHGLGLPEEEHKKEDAKLRRVFDDLLGLLRPLGGYRLVSRERVEDFEDDESGQYEYLLRELRGSSEHFAVEKASLPVRLLRDWCYLLTPGGQPMNLAPLFCAQVCPRCMRVEVFVADELKFGPPGAEIQARGVTSDHDVILNVPRHRRLAELHELISTTAPAAREQAALDRLLGR
ncbi:diguanylate cyclase [Sorangium sp. So ce295]|uniref:diguanylate cyclase domain-containing protein n=1 Tax=Sorangium sp. So ce295 TaxID=3133295 RepID=UPI003F60158F